MSHQLLRKSASVIGLTAGATFVLWVLQEELTHANFSLVYLLVVLIVAIYHGTIASLFAAFICFLCFNFFLVKPLYTFRVADPLRDELLNGWQFDSLREARVIIEGTAA